jgi:hypothetical protein
LQQLTGAFASVQAVVASHVHGRLKLVPSRCQDISCETTGLRKQPSQKRVVLQPIMRFVNSLAYFLLACAAGARAQQSKVLLRDVQALTLSRGKFTTARRVSPIPQLSCVAGDACGLPDAEPDVMQCHNRGIDDSGEPQWECTAEVPRQYRLGRTDVVCEGYSSPSDPYVLRGSCGVEYALWRRQDGARPQGYAAGAQPAWGAQPELETPRAGAGSSWWRLAGMVSERDGARTYGWRRRRGGGCGSIS